MFIIHILSAAAAGMIASINWITRKCVRVKRSPTSIQRESLEIVGNLPPINSKQRESLEIVGNLPPINSK